MYYIIGTKKSEKIEKPKYLYSIFITILNDGIIDMSTRHDCTECGSGRADACPSCPDYERDNASDNDDIDFGNDEWPDECSLDSSSDYTESDNDGWDVINRIKRFKCISNVEWFADDALRNSTFERARMNLQTGLDTVLDNNGVNGLGVFVSRSGWRPDSRALRQIDDNLCIKRREFNGLADTAMQVKKLSDELQTLVTYAKRRDINARLHQARVAEDVERQYVITGFKRRIAYLLRITA